jgi:triacylglycerol lipase
VDNSDYPVILVHGMFGWGADEGINKKIPYWGANALKVTDFFEEHGMECYAASVGPISSAWDRACELYARLTGTTVDYGKAHSEKYGHRRFGRKYDKPLFDGWSSEKKIHLIGHSFGGNTVRMFAYLMTYGSEEKRKVTGSDELSGLFAGGRESFIKTVVTLCAPHNGTVAFAVARQYGIVKILEAVAYNYIGVAGRSKLQGKFVDFHCEQFGLSNTPGIKDVIKIRHAKKNMKSSNDNIEYDMSPEGSAALNKTIEISPDIYYYSYAFDSVTETKRIFPENTDFFFLKLTSLLIIFNGYIKKTDKSRLHNDGLVDVDSALHPADEPFTNYCSGDVKKGIWNVMPVRRGDHGTAIGLFAGKSETAKFYEEIIDLLRTQD